MSRKLQLFVKSWLCSIMLLCVSSTGLAADEQPFPYARNWFRRGYSAQSNWGSGYVTLGTVVQVADTRITGNEFQSAFAFSFGGAFHAGHRLAIPVDLSFRNFEEPDVSPAAFGKYSQTNTLVCTGVEWSPFPSEYFELNIRGLIGLNFNTNELDEIFETETTPNPNEPFNVTTERRSLTRKWGGFEPVIGLGIDLLFFPTHAIELGLSLRTDELLGGANNGSGSTRQWKGSGVVRRVRTSNLIAVRFGFHL